MTPPVFNAALADRVLGHIKANPQSHDQNYYAAQSACGTTGCVAGWTVFLEDLVTDSQIVWEEGLGRTYGSSYFAANGQREHIADRARDLLGITPAQALALFDATRTLPEIETLLKQYANEARP
jgi:hypothetical protein